MSCSWFAANPHVGEAEPSITGHINLLQVRNGAVHILDCEPEAQANRTIARLAIYARALTRLVPGLKLFDIECARFKEEEYRVLPQTALVAPDRLLTH